MSIAHGFRRFGGLGITYVGVVRARLPVYIYDRSSDQIKKSLAPMDKLLAKDVSQGKLESENAKEARDRVVVVGEEGIKKFRDLGIWSWRLVIFSVRPAKHDLLYAQAASENVALKLSLFRSLTKEMQPDAVLATNTSSISITKIAAAAIPESASAAPRRGQEICGASRR
ncbi:hypothetical protein FRC10_009459 [Ceratobasidium sp. 414]|nr:hypothetical protein FRC10_009459 [Ceratobasidium sp. 414]